MIEQFKTGAERLDQPNRHFVVLSRLDQPDSIEAMMSIAFPSASADDAVERLPLERRLLPSGQTLPRFEIKARPLPYPHGSSSSFTAFSGMIGAGHQNLRLSYGEAEVPSGVVAEIKNMATVMSHTPSEFIRYKKLVAAMYHIAELTGVTSFSPTFANNRPVAPLVYYGETDTRPGHFDSERLLNYYLNTMGYKEIAQVPNPDVPGNITHVLDKQ